MRVVVCVATATRMRVQGKVHFELSYDPAECISAASMNRLKKHLGDMAAVKGTLQASAVGVRTGDPNSFSPASGG